MESIIKVKRRTNSKYFKNDTTRDSNHNLNNLNRSAKYRESVHLHSSIVAIEHISNVLKNYNNISERVEVLKSFKGIEKVINNHEELSYFKDSYNLLEKIKWDLYKLFGNKILSSSKPLRKTQLKEALYNAFSYIEKIDIEFKQVERKREYAPFFKYLRSINFNHESFFSKLKQDFYRCSNEFDIVERYINKWHSILMTGVLSQEKDFYLELSKENYIYTFPHVKMKFGKIIFKSDALFFTSKGIFSLNVKKYDDKIPFLITIDENGVCTKKCKNKKDQDVSYISSFIEENSLNYSNLIKSIFGYAKNKNTNYKIESIIAFSNNNIVIKNESNLPIIKLDDVNNYILNKDSENKMEARDLMFIMDFFIKYNKSDKHSINDYLPCISENLKCLIKEGTIAINIINALKYYEKKIHGDDISIGNII